MPNSVELHEISAIHQGLALSTSNEGRRRIEAGSEFSSNEEDGLAPHPEEKPQSHGEQNPSAPEEEHPLMPSDPPRPPKQPPTPLQTRLPHTGIRESQQQAIKPSIYLDTWIPEVAFMAFSLICMTLVIVILIIYNGRPVPHLPQGVTLNAIVATLGTGAKASLVAVVAATMSQAKWCRLYRRPRTLQEVQLIDDGTRGPLESFLMLLDRVVAFSVPGLGALLTILLLTFDPFTQQSVHLPTRQVSNHSELASATQATAFLDADTALFTQAINNAIYGQDFHWDVTCPSGNCTWPVFRSVGWCSMCEDVTSKTQLSGCGAFDGADTQPQSPTLNKTCSVSFGQGAPANVTWQAATFQNVRNVNVDREVIWPVSHDSTSNPTPSNGTFLGVQWPQAVFGHVNMSFNDNAHPEKGLFVSSATECVVSYCVRDFNITVEQGIPSIRNSSTNFGKPFTKPDGFSCWTADPDSIGHMNYTRITMTGRSTNLQFSPSFDYSVDPEHFTFCFDDPSIDPSLNQGLGGWGSQLLVIGGRRNIFSPFSKPLPTPEDSEFFDYRNTEDLGGDFEYILTLGGGLDAAVHRIADSLTRLSLSIANTTAVQSGVVWTPQVFTEVRWAWLSLPILLCLSGAVYLVFVMAVTKRDAVPLWKTSILAYIYHGLDSVPPASDGFETASSMERSAETISVMLKYSDRTKRFGLQ